MVYLPDDIWYYIATFLSKATVRNLLSVNRVFFEMSMAERYRDVEINCSKDQKLLARLR
jgi:hypothetical protein